MRVRVAFDGDKYWVEQRRFLLVWSKCTNYDTFDNRSIRFMGSIRKFDSYEEAYEFARKWLREFSHINRMTVYTHVR